MSQKPAASPRALMDEVERLCTENDGALPLPRAVRKNMKGSQERAVHAILAVQIESGILPHLRHTLPAEFQAELPPAAEILTLTAEAIAELPTEAQRMATGFFAAMGAAARTQSEEMLARVAAAETRYRDETEALRAQLLGASRALDDQERTAQASMQALRDENTSLRVEVGTLGGTVASKETELTVRTQAHDDLLNQARHAAATADARLSARITELQSDLALERDRCRTAEQHVARLTAAHEALQAEVTRRKAPSDSEALRRDDSRADAAPTSRQTRTRSRHRKVADAEVVDA